MSRLGVYDVTLIVDRGSQIDTLIKPGYITVNAPVAVEPVKKQNLVISPNPCNGNFTISIDSRYDMTVMDVLGKTVFTKSENEGSRNFSINLPSGNYFVRILSGGTNKVYKLLVY